MNTLDRAKYRGKRVDNGQWFIGYVVVRRATKGFATSMYDLGGFSVRVDPETVGQFTGLQDKNGVDIYEGDAVHIRIPSFYDELISAEVIYSDWSFELRHVKYIEVDRYEPELDSARPIYLPWECSSIELLGPSK